LGGLGKLGALCGESAILFVKFILQPHRRENTIVAFRGWCWWLAKVTKCATGGAWANGTRIGAKRIEDSLGKPGALCGESAILFVKFVLQPHRRENTIVAFRGRCWWLDKVTKCATGA